MKIIKPNPNFGYIKSLPPMRAHCHYGYPLDSPRVLIAVLRGKTIATEPCSNPFLPGGKYNMPLIIEFSHKIQREQNVIYDNSKNIEWYVKIVPEGLLENDT